MTLKLWLRGKPMVEIDVTLVRTEFDGEQLVFRRPRHFEETMPMKLISKWEVEL